MSRTADSFPPWWPACASMLRRVPRPWCRWFMSGRERGGVWRFEYASRGALIELLTNAKGMAQMPTAHVDHMLDGLATRPGELPILVLPDDGETVALHFLPETPAERPS